MVPGDQNHGDPGLSQPAQLLGRERRLHPRRRHGVEQVSGDQHGVHPLLDRQAGDPRKGLPHLAVLLAAPLPQDFERGPEVDVRGVQEADAHSAAAVKGQI